MSGRIPVGVLHINRHLLFIHFTQDKAQNFVLAVFGRKVKASALIGRIFKDGVLIRAKVQIQSVSLQQQPFDYVQLTMLLKIMVHSI